jgi:hypothetical protein
VTALDRPPQATPWGLVQSAEMLATGIWFVSTEGHGGIWLSPERRAALPAWTQNAPAKYCTKPIWWEEDCEAFVPLLVFYDELKTAKDLDIPSLIERVKSANDWIPQGAL